MGIIQRLTALLSKETAPQTYMYRCTVCHATFESSEAHMGHVTCEQCGANDVRSVATEEVP